MKNQLKKSFSLFLAVIMLMSCWVWIAPSEAEAAGGTTNYYIRAKYNVTDTWDNGSGNYKFYVDYKTLNGTGTGGTHTITPDEGWCNAGEGEQWIVGSADVGIQIPGFPTAVRVYYKIAGLRTYEWDSLVLEVSGDGTTWTTISSGGSLSLDGGWNAFGSKSGTTTVVSSMSNKPYLASLDNIEQQTAELGKLGSSTNATITPQITSGKDQYGVSWEATFPTSGWTHKVATDGEGTTTGLSSNNIYLSANTTSNKPTITAKPATQLLNSNSSYSQFFLISTYSTGAKVTIGLRLTHPEYTATFHGNGGLIGEDDSSASESITIGGADSKKYYGAVIGAAPVYAAKPGYSFQGYYSYQNPDANGLTASFSGTEFKDNETTVPNTGDSHWYAAWQSSSITATFITADNQLIGTLEGRYGNNYAATNMYNGESNINSKLKANYTGSAVTFDTNNQPVYADGATGYTFDGWKIIEAYDDSVLGGGLDTNLTGDVTFQAVYKKADSATYTVSFEDGNGNVISTKNDYKYRDDVIVPTTEPTKVRDDKYDYDFIGWAKDIGKTFYAVDENNCDETGAAISYTDKDGAEFTVRGDASYVPVFRMIPREYSVTYNYTGDNETSEEVVIEGYHWADVVRMPEIRDNYTDDGFRYYIIGWNVGTDTTLKQLNDITLNSIPVIDGKRTLTAVYGDGEAAKYTINFYGKDADGVTDVHLNADTNIYEHNTVVAAPAVAQTIETADSLYTFAGWSPEVSTTATGDANYYATYTKKDYADIYFYNYDGTFIYSLDGKENSLFVGEAIPVYSNIVEGENVLPAKEEDLVGTYTFTGWADGAGNTVVPGTDKFEGDTYLYARFETVYKDYTVKFLNDDGTLISEEKYHYGEEITVPADPAKASDVEYIYDFRAWDPEVSEVCYGDATYTANYRRTPQYYKVTWFNDKKEVLTESNYTYNAKIQQAIIDHPVGYPDAMDGFTWGFKHWVQCDATGNDILVDGNQVLFARGMRMGAEDIYFYPVFEEVANILTVSFYKEDGTTKIGEAKIPYGELLADYSGAFEDEAAKISDDEYHYIIDKWVTVDGGADVTEVKASVSVKPVYTAEAHNKQIYEVVKEPTCTETGLAHMKCNVPECTDIDYNVVLDVVPDEAAPTGQIYVGLDKWTLNDFATINYTDVKYVGPTTNVIINATDLGIRTMPWNLDAEMNRGVGKIDYYISETTVDASGITEWTDIYNYNDKKADVLHDVLLADGKTLEDYNAYDEAQKAVVDAEVNAIMATYKANVTGILSNIGLVNGKEYIIYVRVSDREVNGTSNVCYFSSGKFHYGSTPAEIAITGNGYGTKFCAAATIKVTDDTDGFKTYLNGEEITLTDGEYVCNEKGVHIVEVVDKNGNKTTRSFEIKGAHTYRNYTTSATCENDGSRYDLCTLCGYKANEEILPALGHSYTINYVEKDATCVDDGYRTYTCDNNCGTKIVINPDDNAETIAQAKKYVEAAEGEEGTWEALTAEDIAHLKATGLHTYAKVKDENGEDTAEDAWVIDKAATCKVVGSKHKDCTKCGERVTEEIAPDTENGHKFYRAKVTTEPTCTTEGERTKTCRYCGKIEVVEAIPALGHTAGEYKVIAEPTCTTEGSKILTCSVCGVDIGEPVEGEEVGFDGKAVVIPALDHAWKLDGEPYKEVTIGEDGNEVTTWYQNYKCSNAGCEEIDKRVLEDYVEPIAATVTFMNGEEDEAPQVFEGYVGNSIVASAVTEPTKAADATYKYTFSHWATKNADGTYTEVSFPIVVAEGGATYYAIYAEKYINYTITYYKEDGITEYKKVGYLHNGEAYDLVAGPAKAETWQYTYKFAGWKVNGTEEVLTDTVTINGANINLTAVYDAVLRKYAVSYAYSWENILETFEVNAGDAARGCAIIPEKQEDSKYHYEFAGWNRAEQLKSVESNIYTTPEFTAIEHEFTESIKAEATCTTNKVVTKTCTCGYSYDVEIANSALGHLWGDPIEGEGGVNVVECQRDGCDASEDDTRTYTVKFFVDADDDKAIKTLSYIPWGSTIDATRLPADPTKESTSSIEYEFKGWALKGTKEIVDFATYKVTSDVTFVADFDEITREYTVIFAYDAYNTIAVFKNVPAGEDVTYAGETPTKAYDELAHYEFSNWSGLEKGNNTIENVQGDVYVTAKFDKIEHSYIASELNEATCKNGKGTRYSCECGHYYDVTGKPLPHEYEATANRREPTPTQNGFQEYKCKNCGETYEEELIYADNTITITVTVTHNGAVKSGIRVEVQAIGVDTPFVATTNANGVATFKVDKDYAYNCWVTVNGEKIQVALENGANGNLIGNYGYTDQGDCTCACHRDNLWGAIFRFFHKIIKLFTGEFKCCGNPDPMYG